MTKAYALRSGAIAVLNALLLSFFFLLPVSSFAQTVVTEDFDSGIPATWSNAVDDNFDWQLGNGTTPTPNTGPSDDAFRAGGSYLHISNVFAALAGNVRGDIASFISDPINLTGIDEMQFYYHMYGAHTGALDVEVESPANSGIWQLEWSLRGDQGDAWHRADVDLSDYTGTNVRIRFIAELDGAPAGDIAIDLIQLGTDVCQPPLLPSVVQEDFSAATVAFNTNDQTSFILEYGPPGFTTPTGTVYPTTSPYTITGLSSGTTYEFTVASNCASETSLVTAPVSFTTTDCDIPTNFASTGKTESTIDVAWSTVIANTFDISYQLSNPSGTDPNAGTIVTGVTGSSYSVSGLSNLTDYDIYIRGNCGNIGGGASAWEGPITITTECGYPCNVGIGSGTASNGTTGYPAPYGNYYYGARHQFLVRASELTSLGISPGNLAGLSFDVASINSGATLSNFTIGVGFTSLTSLSTSSNIATSTVMNPVNYAPSAGINYHAFDTEIYWNGTDNIVVEVCFNNSGWTNNESTFYTPTSFTSALYYRADNSSVCGSSFSTASTNRPNMVFVFNAPPSCLPVGGLSATAPAFNSAAVNWASQNGGSNFEVEYGPSGFTQGTGTVISVSSATVSLTGLSGNTTYDIYVREVCSPTDQSAWSYTSVTTPLPPITAPWLEDFEGFSTGTLSSQNGWSTDGTSGPYWSVDNGGTPSSSTGPSIDHTLGTSSGKYVYLETSSGSSGAERILESPLVSLGTLLAPQLRFYYSMYGASMGGLAVDIVNNGVTTNMWSITGQQHTDGNTYSEAQIDLSSYVGQAIQIVFRGTRGTSYTGDMAIDDVEIREGPTCPKPTNLAADTVSHDYVGFSWSPAGSGTSFQYAINDLGSTGLITGSSAFIDTLSQLTTYNIWVREICSVGDTSEWLGPLNFTTGIAPCSSYPCNTSIGSGTGTTTRFPIYSCYGYNYTQLIYHQSEINAQGAISTLRFNYTGGGTSFSTWSNWTVFMGHTSKEEFSSSSDWVDMSQLTQVFSGAITVTGPGWVEIQIPTPLLYNNVDNLVIAIYENSPSYSCTASWSAFNSGQNRGINFYSDGTNPNPSSPPSANYGPNGTIPQVELVVDAPPTCPVPTDFMLDSLSSDFASLSWIGDASSLGYLVEYGTPADFSASTTTQVFVSAATIALNGLIPSTSYDVVLREVCAVGDTSNSISLNFTTLPPTISSFPYLNDFETDAFGWAASGNNSSWQYGTPSGADISSAASGSQAWVTNLSGLYNASELSYLVSPIFDLSSATLDPSISFNLAYYTESCCDEGWFEYSVDGGATWTKVTNFISNGYNDLGNSWWDGSSSGWNLVEPVISGLAGNSQVVFRFVFSSDGSVQDDGFGMDDFSVVIPTCPIPSGLTVDDITYNSVDISWTAGPLGVSWLVQAIPAGTTPDPSTAISVPTTSYSFTGLSAQTTYDLYVWEVCSSDTASALSLTSITTPCAPVSAPFVESFDGTTIPTCWAQSVVSGDGWRFTGNPGYTAAGAGDHTGNNGNFAWIDFSGTDLGTVLELPTIDVSGLSFPALEFYFYSYYNGTLSPYNYLYVEAFVGGSWVSLESYQENTGGWTKKIVDISSGVSNGMVQLRFRGESGGSSQDFYNDLLIDDISIDEIGCITPTALTVDEVYMDEAYLSWNAGGFETTWQVYYGETGVVSAPGQSTVPTTTVSQTEINITGLTALTGYSVWVRSDCGSDQSLWTAAANFTTTTCPKVVIDTYPYTEGFDTTTVTQVPCGWAFDDGNSDNIQWGVQNRASIAQSNPSMARIEWNTTQDMDDHIMSPRIDLDAYEQVDITFSYRTRSDAFVERMSMAFAQDQDPAQVAAPFWNETNLTNTDYITETVTHRPTAAGEYAVAWHGFSTADQFAIYIDDVEIDRTECQSPYLITLDNSDFYSVDISWSGEGSNYIVEYGPAGFTPGSGTTVSVAGLATTLSGLSLGTNYEVYVTTDCGASGTSIPEGPFAFSTDCPTLNVVYADLCLDNGLFQLTGGLPLGGTYSGTGVDANGNFDPVVAGVGTHTITYSFPNMNACPVDVTAPIKVNALPVVNVAPFGSVCIGVAPFELTNGTPAGGIYSMVSGGNANAITNGNMFNPAVAGLGLHQIEYTYVDGNGCVNSQIANINITPLPTVTLAAQPSFCGTGDNPASLAGGSPAGGTYSGPGVVNGVFYPDLAGLGSHTITYTYFSGPGCSNTATRTIVVNDVAAVDAGADIEIQYGTNDQIMTSVVGGTPPFTYSWQPADSLVNPTNANPTTKNLAVNNTFIVYVTDAQGCVSTDTVEVTVKGGPLNLGTSGDVTICQGESATLVALPQGGSEVYSYYWTPATGLSAPNDSITVASPNQTRTYTLTLSDGFNVRSSTITVTVLPAPQVGMGQLGSVCVNAGSVMLDQGYPAGGVYMGTGVSGGQFDPAVAGVGNHTISYEYTDANGCSAMTTGTITVHAEPSVSFAALSDVCLDAGDVILAGGAPLGGSYSGPGVAGGVFTPTNAGIGVHTIDYTYADINGCAVTVSQSVEVFALPSVGIASQGTVCIDGGAVTLSGGFPAGGTYSGTGVTAGSFDPAAAGLGAHAITYTYSDANGCDLSVQTNIVVTDLPAVDHTNIAPVCVSDAAFMLSGGNPAGGSYSGTGVSGGMFNPAIAGVGSHVVVYSYTDGYGCTNSISKVVTVNDLPAVTLAPVADRCVNSAAVALTGGFPLGGSYSGAGVMNGMFNPAVAGVGAHTITYSYTNASGCQASAQYTVNVSAQPVVSFNVPSAVCTNNGAVTLSGGSPAGGSYSGAGVSNGMFYPSAVGAGSHTITYSYTDGNGCTSSTTATMIVYALPQVSAAPLGSVCINGGNVSLTGASPAGGTFSGPGVSGTSFDPVAAGIGTHVLTYSYTNANGCTNATNFSVTVNPQPIASFGAVGPVCVNAAPFTLLAGQPGGGNYSGTGVSNNTFNPAVAGVGSHVITYTYTNALGCTDVVTQTVDVIAEPTVTLAALSDVCKGDGSVTLSGGSPAGGTYSGPGVSAGAFNPVLVAAGTYTITYTYTAANGCASSDQSTITVLPAPVQPYITQSGNTLNAITTLTNVSYQWLDGQGNAIPGATNNTLDVQVNGFFYVQITDANGCTSISDVFVVDFTSINDPMAALQFELFPNPNAGRFQMNWTSLSDQDFQVAVTDARGKVIYTESVNARAGQMSELSVDLSDMAKGVYFVQLKGEEGVINRQVVIQ